MSLEKTMSEHRRLTILRVLEKAPGYSANCSIIKDSVVGFGINSSRDQVRNEMRWLAEQGLLQLEDLGIVMVGKLTDDGLEVARGNLVREGVKRPSPFERR
ncbi:MAG: hypothetical protein ACK4Q4_00695 [Rhodocyclaceae bacterium]